MVGNINAERAKNPEENFTEDDWKRFNHALSYLDSTDLEIADTSGLTVKSMKAELARIKAKYGEHRKYTVIVDYLQLMQGKGKGRVEDVSEISRGLKLLAKDEKYVVLALSQLSRGVEARQDKRPMLQDLRESGSIEQDADIVAFLYCDYYYNPNTDDKNITELIIAKQRAGSIGVIKTYFDRETLKFRDLSHK